MNRSDTEEKSTGGAVVSNATNTRLTGSWLLIARVVWLVLVVPSLGLFLASLPVYYQQLQAACVDAATCYATGALSAQEQQALSTLGFSASGYATLVTLLSVITTVVWCGIGLLIFWRRSDNWLALLAAFFLVMFSLTISGNSAAFADPALALSLKLVGFLGQVSLGVFFVLFPNGRLVPRWMGLILPLVILNAFFSTFPSTTSPFNTFNWPLWLNLLLWLVIYGVIIFSQMYRYRRLSTPVQRQQTKWVILGVAAALGVVVGLIVIAVLIPSIDNTPFYDKWWSIIYPVVLLLIPFSIGFSILHYRLYDIDVLINRTLVYGSSAAIRRHPGGGHDAGRGRIPGDSGHHPLRLAEVPGRLSTAGLVRFFHLICRALDRDFGLAGAPLAVAALNPHAGEGGMFGREEEEIIIPAIKQAQAAGLPVEGPFPADTLFWRHRHGEFAAVVCMYHDQGLIPLKLLHFIDGVNVTLGLPIIRTSVDHGTAYDLAGTGRATPDSLKAAIKMAAAMAKRRFGEG